MEVSEPPETALITVDGSRVTETGNKSTLSISAPATEQDKTGQFTVRMCRQNFRRRRKSCLDPN